MSLPSFAFLAAPLPFCVPPAVPEEIGTGTSFPIELNNLDDLCRAVWRVRTWRCELLGVANEFATYQDYTFDFANHEQTGNPPPESVLDVICGYGINLEHVYSVPDSLGGTAEFRLRILALDAGQRDDPPERYFTNFLVELDLLLPSGSPPQEIVLRSLQGSAIAGALQVDSAVTDLYTGFPGQLATAWQGSIVLTAIEEWDF